jgi:hypothetical protein
MCTTYVAHEKGQVMSTRKRYLAVPQGVIRGRITSMELKLCGTLDSAWNYVYKRGTRGYGLVIELTRAGAIREAQKGTKS